MSASKSYSLLDEPWIPVRWDDGAADKVGIRCALAAAHKIRAVSHSAPFIEFGLYRVLIAIVLDAYIIAGQRPTIDRMRAILEKGLFDELVLLEYLRSQSRGFDLWARGTPFLQRTSDGNDGKKLRTKAVVAMFPAIPSGTNAAHWHHYFEDEGMLCDEVAAQFLTTISPFNFKVKPGEARSLTGDPPLYAIVLGKNLLETIVLNLPRQSGRTTAAQEKDNGPAWRTQLDLGKLPKAPTIGQAFTWPVRIIELQKDGDAIINAVNQAAYSKPTNKGKARAGNLYESRFGWRDPNAGTETRAGGVSHIKARPGVAVWRDAVPLFLLASEGEALRGERRRSRPEVITNALRILGTPQFRVAVYGMRKKSGGGGDVKVEEWFRSVFGLPAEVARDTRLSARAIDAFKAVQKVADALSIALRMLRPPVKASKSKRPQPNRAETDVLGHFWQNLEPVMTRSYLDALASNQSNVDSDLLQRVWTEANDAFAFATEPHRRTADGLFRIANASNWFGEKLANLLRRCKKRRFHEQR